MHQFILKPKCTNMFFNFNQMGKLNMKIYEFMKNKECKLIQLTVTNNKWQNHCSIIYSYHLVTIQIIDLSQKVNNFHNLIFSYFDLRINRKLEIKDNLCTKNLWMIILFSNMYIPYFLQQGLSLQHAGHDPSPQTQFGPQQVQHWAADLQELPHWHALPWQQFFSWQQAGRVAPLTPEPHLQLSPHPVHFPDATATVSLKQGNEKRY